MTDRIDTPSFWRAWAATPSRCGRSRLLHLDYRPAAIRGEDRAPWVTRGELGREGGDGSDGVYVGVKHAG